MKNYQEIRKELAANNEKIAAIKDKIASAETYHEQNQLYIEKRPLETVNRILTENIKAAFCGVAFNIVSDIMQPLAGKSYGPKTKDKTSKQAHAAGMGFYFDTDYTGGFNKMHVYGLTDAGYTDYLLTDITIYATDENGQRAYFIDNNNKVCDFSKIRPSFGYHYIENVAGRVADLENAFQEYKKAAAIFEHYQSQLNSLLPENCNNYYANIKTDRLF